MYQPYAGNFGLGSHIHDYPKTELCSICADELGFNIPVEEIEISLSTLEEIRNFLKKGQEFDLDKDLFAYQQEDVDTILEADRNFLILSEMGTGKTPEIIKIAEELNYSDVLILCPKSLRREWERQIIQWTGEPPITCGRGSTKRLNPFFDALGKELRTGEKKSRYFILNYETFRIKKHTDLLVDIPWGLIIMDEAHHIRNPETKTTKSLMRFLEHHRGARIIALTGSPVVNSPLDLFTLLMVIRPEAHTMRTRYEFLERFTYWTPRRGGAPKVLGIRDKAGLHNYIKEFSIRRLKVDVLPYLPDKYRRDVTLEMEVDQAKHYKTLATELVFKLDDGETISSPGILSLLTRLRQMNLDPMILGINASSSKTEFLMDLVKESSSELFQSGEQEFPTKLVVFSTFASYIKLVSEMFKREGIQHIAIHGGVDVDERSKRVEEFQTNPMCQVALGTIKTMGEGITLTAASDVVLMDRWWTPSANNQAIDRLHRPSQKNAVQIIRPSNDKSIDMSLDSILKEKEGMTDALFNESSVIQEVVEDLRRTAAAFAFSYD